MAERRYHSARQIGGMVQLEFRQGQFTPTITIPIGDAKQLANDILNLSQPEIETPSIRRVLGIRQVRPDDATQPMTLRIVCEAKLGRLEIPISHTAAVELEEELRKQPLARGSL